MYVFYGQLRSDNMKSIFNTESVKINEFRDLDVILIHDLIFCSCNRVCVDFDNNCL